MTGQLLLQDNACPYATATSGGCLSTGDQHIGGIKRFEGGLTTQVAAGYSIAAWVMGDLYLTGKVHAPEGNSVTLEGARVFDDPGPDIVFRTRHERINGAPVIAIYDNTGRQLFAVTANGEVLLTGPPRHTGDVSGYAQIVDNTGVAGHVMLRAGAGHGVVVEGRFEDPTSPYYAGTMLLDGGGELDGGHLAFSGNHGEFTVVSGFARRAGWMVDIRNTVSGIGALTDVVQFLNYQGGQGTLAGIPRAQFARCPAVLLMSTVGQFYDGTFVSTRMWAADEERYYVCTSAGWRREALDQ